MYPLLIVFALSNLLYFALHVTPGGSFPKPLSQKEERECLEKIKQGDLEAKNRLIEHNLRLVAHIIKRIYNKSISHGRGATRIHGVESSRRTSSKMWCKRLQNVIYCDCDNIKRNVAH